VQASGLRINNLEDDYFQNVLHFYTQADTAGYRCCISPADHMHMKHRGSGVVSENCAGVFVNIVKSVICRDNRGNTAILRSDNESAAFVHSA
jgi:hypothetical protein